MVAALAFLAMASVAQPAAEAVPVCTLVTPGGHAIGFYIGGDDQPNHIRLSATSGSIWPAATLRASAGRSGSSLRFAIGTGRRGLTLELRNLAAGQTQRLASLFLRDGETTSVPVAFGYCEDRPVDATATLPSSDPAAVGADQAAFDPARWPEDDCALLLSDGRRIRFTFTLTKDEQLRLASRELWAGRSITMPIRWLESREFVQLGAFGGEGADAGPEGLQMMFVDERRAAKLIRFRRLGDAAMPSVSGYGMCGYSGRVRRPNLR